MKLHELESNEGARKTRNRVGRGMSSGNGKTSDRGHKGQKARTGGGVRPGFEGGQMPLFQRLPTRGFTNINRKEYAVVNLDTLNEFEVGTEITPELLQKKGDEMYINSGSTVLGRGSITHKYPIQAHNLSARSIEAL